MELRRTESRRRTGADRRRPVDAPVAARRDVVDKNAILGARRSTTAAIVVSGIRCIITYLLIPILAPVIGISDAASAPVTIALSALAIVMGVTGVRRFWMADHRARWLTRSSSR